MTSDEVTRLRDLYRSLPSSIRVEIGVGNLRYIDEDAALLCDEVLQLRADLAAAKQLAADNADAWNRGYATCVRDVIALADNLGAARQDELLWNIEHGAQVGAGKVRL